MRIFFDTEFTSLGLAPNLISIGLVDEAALDDAKANRLGWIAAGGDTETKIAPARFTL
jgi:hypothetical protein